MSTKQSENYMDVLRELGYKPMTGSKFEKLKGEHIFTEAYQKQRDYLLSELKNPARIKNRYGWQLALRIFMIICFFSLCVPGAIYALNKVHQVMLTGDNNRERLTFGDTKSKKIDVENGMWEYIHIDCTYLPKGVILDGSLMGYSGGSEEDADWKEYGRFAAYRWDHNTALDTEAVFGENVVKGNTGNYDYIMASKAEGWKEVYIKYIPADVVVCTKISSIYGVDEIMAVIAGLRFQKAADDAEKQTLSVILPEDDKYLWGEKKNAEYMKNCDYVSVGKTFYQDGLSITVKRIEIVKTVDSYQKRYFKEQSCDGMLDEDGKLRSDYRFIYVTLTVKNEDRVKITDYYVNQMRYWVLKKQGSSYKRISVSQCQDSPVYFDASIEGADKKGFFRLGDIQAEEEITYHIGYFVPEDAGGELWLSMPKSQDISDEFTFVKVN